MAGIAVLALLQFFSVPIIIHHVGAEEYGLYVLILTIGGFVVLADMGLNEATTAFVARYRARNDPDGVRRVFGATTTVYAGVSMAGASIIAVFAPEIVRCFKINSDKIALAVTILRFSGIAFFLSIWVGVLEATLQAVHRFDLLTKTQLAHSVFYILGVIIALQIGFGLKALVIWLIVTNLLKTVFLAVIVKKQVPEVSLWPKPCREGFKEVFGYGVFSFINALVFRISEAGDRLLLGMFLGTTQVSYLAVPKQILDYAATAHGTGGKVLFPQFSSMFDDQSMRTLFIHSTAVLLCVSLSIFVPLIVVLPEFLRLWIGPAFASESALPAQIIAGSYAFHGAFAPYLAFLKGTGRIKWLSVITVIFGGSGIGLSILFISKMGLTGAGLRTWPTLLIGFGIIAVILWRIFKEREGLGRVFIVITSLVLQSFLIGSLAYLLWQYLALSGWWAVGAGYCLTAFVLSLSLITTMKLVLPGAIRIERFCQIIQNGVLHGVSYLKAE